MYLQVPLDVALCICNRPLQDILCRSCGYIFVGRQRKRCSVHSNEIQLMDSAVCPKCRTNSLMEIKKSEAMVKKHPDKVMNELANLRQRRSSGGEKCLAVRQTSIDGDNEIDTLPVSNFLVEVPGAPDMTNLKKEWIDGNVFDTMPVTAHSSKGQPELSRLISAASSYTQEVHACGQVSESTKVSAATICAPDAHSQVSSGITAPECKYLSQGEQAKFVTEVLQQPKFYQRSPLNVRPTAGGCQSKKLVSCDGENSVLKAVLKKSIAGHWYSGIDKMTDLCIGEKR